MVSFNSHAKWDTLTLCKSREFEEKLKLLIYQIAKGWSSLWKI